MDISPPLDPKAFPSYDAYCDALEIRGAFAKYCEEADAVIANAKSDEEMQRGMEALGFTYVEDETCGRAWCADQEECLWIAIESFQDICNHAVFDHLLAREDLLLRDEEINACLERGCDAIPPSWFDERKKEHHALTWFIAVSNALLLEMEREESLDVLIAKQPDLQEFYRQAYFAALSVVRTRPWPDAEKGKRTIEAFLGQTNLLPQKRTNELLEQFRAFMG